MTPEEFLQSLIETALPSFTGKIHTGNGADFATFFDEVATEKPSAFISYEGYKELDITENGTTVADEENYTIYLRTNDSVKPYQKALRAELLAQNSEFTDDEGNSKYVSMPSGQAYRDGGADAFQINVTIK